MEMEEACIVSNCLTMQASSFAGRFFCFTRPPGLRTKTEFIGFAGSQARTAPAPGPPFLEFTARGSRKETEFIGFAGSQARTVPAPGPPFLIFRPGGSRKETEFIGFAGSQARTAVSYTHLTLPTTYTV